MKQRLGRWVVGVFSLALLASAGAQVPAFTSSTNTLGAVGVPFSYQATASGSPTNFAILNPPTWLRTNVVGPDGVFSGLPQTAGNLTLQMVASNASGATTNNLYLQVNPPPKPQITSPLVVFAAEGVQFGYNFQADPDPLYVPTVIGVSTNNGASFLTNNLDDLGNGLQLRTSNAVNPVYPFITNIVYRISGTTLQSGTFQLPVRAVNGMGPAQTSLETLTLVVGPGGDPVITSPTAAPGIVGVPFNFTVTAANSPLQYVFSTNNGVSWSPAGTVLSGLTFSNVIEGPNRYARITGIPSFAKTPGTAISETDPVSGAITNFVIGSGGSGYSSPPAVWIQPPPAGGGQAEATAQVSPGGVVTNLVINNSGSGYTSAPAVVIADLLLKAGNNNAPAGGPVAPLQITIAEPQPTIVLTQPLGEANYVSGSSFFVNAQAFDAVPDIIIPGSVTFLANGVALTGQVGRLGEVYGQEFYPNVASPQLVATAQNTLGQTSTSVVLPMTDEVPRRPLPAVEMLPLNPGPAPQAGGVVTLRARATIPSVSTSIDRVEFYVNKVYVGAAQSATNNEYEFQWQTPAQAGSYEVQARAVSVNINPGELGLGSPPFYASVIARRPVIVNTLPGIAPVVAITAPADNGVLAVGVANRISATASLDGGAVDSVSFYANGRLIGEDAGVPFEIDFTPNSFGTYELFAIAKGSNGLQTVSPVVIANAPSGFVPTVTIDSPTAGITLPFGSPILVAYTSQDTDGFVQSLQLLVNGAVVDELDATVNGLIGNGLIPYTPPSQGVYNFVVRVTDNQGNSGVSAPVQVTVQSGASNPLPTVVLSSQTFAENRYVVGSEFFFNATVTPKEPATIPDGGVDFFVGNNRLRGTPSGLPSGQGVFSARDRLDNEGQLQVFATAKDSADNTGISGRVPILLNNPRNPLPVVEVLPLNPGTSPAAGGTVRLRARAIFPSSTPDQQRVEFYVRGVLVGVGVPNANDPQVYEFEWRTPATPASFKVDARAVAANYATVFAGENFVVYGSALSATHRVVTTGESALPTVSIKSPVNNTSVPVGGSITLQATASIAGSTIARVDYYGNGELLGSSTTAGDSYSVTFTPNSKGEVKLIAVAVSAQGFEKESEAVTINVPLAGDPTIKFLSPEAGTTFTPGTTFTAAAEVEINPTLQAPIRDVRFFVNEVLIGEPDTSAPYSQQITLDSVGNYFLKAIATDIYGNTATVQRVVASRAPPSGAAPIITVTHPTPGGGGDVENDFSTPSQFFFNALVTLPTGVTVAPGGVKFFANGVPVAGTVNRVGDYYSIFWQPERNADYLITAQVTDSRGISAVSEPLTFVIAPPVRPLPTVSLLPLSSPTAATGSTVYLQAQTNGDITPVARVDFYANGVLIGSRAVNTAASTVTIFEWIPEVAGDYTLTARAIQVLGEVGDNSVISAARSLNVVAATGRAPLVTLSQQTISEARYVAGSQFFFNATAVARDGATVAGDGVDFYYGNQIFKATATGVKSGAQEIFAARGTLTVAPSTEFVFATAIDSNNSIGSSAVAAIIGQRPLNPLPAVQMEPYLPGALQQAGGTVQLRASALFPPNASTDARVEFYANGAFVGTGVADATNPTLYTFDWKTPTTPAQYEIHARAVALNFQTNTGNDNAERFFGSVISALPLELNTIPGVLPAVAITSPVAGASIGVSVPTTIRAAASVAPGGGTIKEVRFFANGVLVGEPDVQGPAYEVEFTPLSAGLYSLYAIAETSAGLIKVSDERLVNVVSGSPPTVDIVTPKDGLETPTALLTVAWVASDADGSVQKAQVFVNGAPAVSPSGEFLILDAAVNPAANPGSNRASYLPPSQGVYDFVVRVTDNFGNVTDSAPVQVKVNNAAKRKLPTVNLVQPSGITAAVVGSQFYLNASVVPAEDATIPNSGVSFYRQGVKLQGSVSRLGDIFASTARLDVVNQFPYVNQISFDPSQLGTEFFAEAQDSEGLIGVSEIIRIGAYAPRAPLPSVEMLPLYGGGDQVGAGGIVRIQARASFPTPPAPAAANPLVEFFANGTWIGLGQVDSNGIYFLDWTTPKDPRAYVITARAQSVNWQAGTIFDTVPPDVPVIASSISANFTDVNTLTVEPPNVELTAPAEGAVWSVGVPSLVSAQASIPPGGIGTIQRVEFYANGRLIEVPPDSTIGTNPDLSGPYQIEFAPQSPGPYSLVAVAYSTSGAVQSSSVVKINAVLGAAPTVNITNPVNTTPPAEVTPGIPVAVTVNAADSDGSVARVDLLVNGVIVGFSTQAPYIFTDAGQFSGGTNTTFTPPSEGQYVIVARATDNLGNVTESAPVTVRAKSPTPIGVAPSVQITQPVGEIYYVTGSSLFLNARATDAPPGVVDPDSVNFTVNGLPIPGAVIGQIGNDYGVRYTPTEPFSIDTIRAQATDNEGNTTYSQPNYTVLTLAQAPLPQVQMLPLLPGAPLDGGGKITLRAQAFFPPTANQQARVEFYANNIYVGTATQDATDPRLYTLEWESPLTPAAYVIEARAVALNFQTNVGEGNVIEYFGSVISDNNIAVNTMAGNPPVVTITSPAPNAAISLGQPTTISASAFVPLTTISAPSQVNGKTVANPGGVNVSVGQPVAAGAILIITDGGFVSTPVAGRVAEIFVSNGQTLRTGQPLVRLESVNELGGTIERVEFYANGRLIQSSEGLPNPDTTAPYAVQFTPDSVGLYNLSAIAYSDAGLLAVSPLVPVSATLGQPPTAILTANTAATATAVVSGGGVSSISVVQGRSGYTTPPAVALVGGGGTGAQAVALLGSGTNTGKVVGFTVTAAGTGYTTAPTVVIDPPPGIVGTTVNFNATASDADGVVRQVEFFVNGVSQLVVPGPRPNYAFPLLLTSAGPYRVEARVTDDVGNIASSNTVLLTAVAGQPPTVQIVSPANNSTIPAGQAVQVIANASDPDGTVVSVTFYANKVAIPPPVTGNNPYTIDFTASGPGTYELVAEALDSSGNTAESDPVIVTVPDSVLTVQMVSPPPPPAPPQNYLVGSPVLLTATASTSVGATVTSVDFVVNNVRRATVTQSPFVASFTPESPNTYSVVAVARDSTGKAVASLPATFTASSPAPGTVTPSLIFGAPSQGDSWTAGSQVYFNYTVNVPAGTVLADSDVKIYANSDELPGVQRIGPTGRTFAAPYELPGVGTVTVYATARVPNGAGSVIVSSAPTVLTVQPSATPPNPVLMEGYESASGFLAVGEAVRLKARARFFGLTAPALEFYANGVFLGTGVAGARNSDDTVSYTLDWTPNVAGTDVSLTARAVGVARTASIGGNSVPVYISAISTNQPNQPVNNLEIVEVPAPGDVAPGSNQAFVLEMYGKLLYRQPAYADYRYFVDRLNKGGRPAPVGVRADAVMELMGYNTKTQIFNAAIEYAQTSALAFAPYARLGLSPVTRDITNFINLMAGDPTPLPITGVYSGIPDAPWGATFGMATAMQAIFNSPAFAAKHQGVMKFNYTEFYTWMAQTMFPGRFAGGEANKIVAMMQTITPQSIWQGSGAAFRSQLVLTMMGNGLDASGSALEKAFQSKLNSAALQYQWNIGRVGNTFDFKNAPDYSKATVQAILAASAAAPGPTDPVKRSQTISAFQLPSSIDLDNSRGKKGAGQQFRLQAQTSAGLKVSSFRSSDTSVVSIKGDTATVHRPGEVRITAHHPGNAGFKPVSAVKSVRVYSGRQGQKVLKFKAPGDVNAAGNSFTLTATTSANLKPKFQSSNTRVIRIKGRRAIIVGTGTATISAYHPGTSKYKPAAPVKRQIRVW